MEFLSVLNDILGPVMRGPSSSHTAGSHHIGRLVRSLLRDDPATAEFTFDPSGSYAATYRQQGVDLALTAGLLGWPITDRRFVQALVLAARQGLKLRFQVAPLKGAEHPNTVAIEVVSKSGKALRVRAKSIGGGMIIVDEFDGWPVRLDGKSHEVMVLAGDRHGRAVGSILASDGQLAGAPGSTRKDDSVFLSFKRRKPMDREMKARLDGLKDVRGIWSVPPLFFVQKGAPLFRTGAEMLSLARRRRLSLGRITQAYEARLLGLSETEVLDEIGRRFDIMRDSVRRGLAGRDLSLRLLEPSAGKVFRAEERHGLAAGGLHARAAARAMAALHVSNSMGIVCAAPTGGSAGVLPGVAVTLAEERKLDRKGTSLALLAAGAIGLIIARRATFAAEVAGCQVEIGAAGAMAAAAVVEASGGSAAQAADAAAISLQNTMGSVCDLVQGMCEIPCHTRNAVAASSAFVCADLVLGGYKNPIPLDETIDAAFAAGKMLPAELRCTALGGLAITPSGLSLRRRR